MITIEAVGKDIHVFGRDSTTKARYHNIITNFDPYFYVEDIHGEYRTIEGKTVKKVFVSHPAEVRTARMQYEKTWEADIPYVNRYLIDKVDKIDEEPIRVCHIDIETLGEKGSFPKPEEAAYPIISICCYDNFTDKYTILSWNNKNRVVNYTKGNHVYQTYPSEREMMLHFFDYLKETDPDLMTAWFGDLFDFPYLVNRVSRIGLDVDSLGRLSGTRAEMFGNRLITTIRGRALLDLYWGYRYIIFTGRESWSLDYIAKYEKLGLKKIEYEGAIDDLWEKDIDAVMEYNQMDVEIIVALDKKMNIINFFDSLRRMTVCNWNNLFARSQMHDLHILKWCHNHGIVLPCKPEYVEGASDESFQGALVLDPIKGLHEQIFVFDLKSFYLSMAVSCNMSYETISSDGEIKLGNGICFKKEPKGIIPSVVEDLFNLRNSYKALKSAAPYGSSEWKKYDMLQYCVKMLTASLYGAIAYPRFRLNKKEISSTITWLGREILTHTKKILEENGCIVITGDTDSILFKLKEPKSSDEAVKEGVRLLEIINGSYSDFVKQWGIDKHIIQIDFEKIFSTGLFLTKKRYAGKICWSGGKFVDDWDIKGMESKRSDTPHLVGEKQKEIVHSILNKESKESVISSLKLFINYLKNECAIEDIAMPTGITKMPELYGKNGKGVPAHVRACLYANKLHRANITGGVKVKWLYVVPKVRVDNKRVDVIAFTNKMHSGYEVDWEKMLNRLVYMKFDGIFSALGWDVRALSGQQTLEGFK